MPGEIKARLRIGELERIKATIRIVDFFELTRPDPVAPGAPMIGIMDVSCSCFEVQLDARRRSLAVSSFEIGLSPSLQQLLETVRKALSTVL